MRAKLRAWLDKLRSELRSEVNVGQPGERGRTYVKTVLKPSIYARIYRATEGKWYDLGKL